MSKIIKNFRCTKCGIYYELWEVKNRTSEEYPNPVCDCDGDIKITDKPLITYNDHLGKVTEMVGDK